MSVSEGLSQWLRQVGADDLQTETIMGGGCINRTSAIRTKSGKTCFLKQNAQAPTAMFAAEARSLQILASTKTLRIPQVYYQDENCLLLEYLPSSGRQSDYWELFGRQLARLHSHTSDHFGLDFDTFCGTTCQSNSPNLNGHDFFYHQRLMPLGEMALARGLWASADMDRLECLGGKLTNLIPPQPASMLHGDLWSGNAHTGPEGEPVLIDPAHYYGWREAELGMTQLFGGFPPAFYAAYEETWPLEPGWRGRLDIYNLYHLLNHLVLFGGGYLGQVRAVLHRY